MKILVEILGWYGTVAVVLAYALLSFSVLQPTDLIYLHLNITGAIGILLVSLYKKAYQPAVVNIVWAAIALATILKILF